MNTLQNNHDLVIGLKPERLWEYFAEISNIPRGSGDEDEVANFVYKLAKKEGFIAVRDKNNNVVVYVPATPGFENRPSVCLQGHLDMVCEKLKDSRHDFMTEPIQLVIDGGKLSANGTTLGADNGIGVATMLAIMTSKEIEHGPLELLFTTKEEVGFDGASALDPNMFKSKTFINLDSEEEGELYFGCAGGGRINGTGTIIYVPSNSDMQKCRLTIQSLKGGHSGLEIHLGHANAIKLLSEILSALSEFNFQIITIKAGNKMNAIPREAEVLLLIPIDQLNNAKTRLEELIATINTLYQQIEPDMQITLEDLGLSSNEQVIDEAGQTAVLELIEALPNGVIAMDPNNQDLVQTSNNVGILNVGDGKFLVTCMFRSSVESDMDDIQFKIIEMIEGVGAIAEIGNRYPAWEPHYDTPLLQTAVKTYQDLYGVEPPVKTIHAGLACAVFYKMFPGADIISFGPTMVKVHTPDENVDIASVEKFWNYLLELLKNIGALSDSEA